MKRNHFIALLFTVSIFFIAYLISVVSPPNNWGDILSPINAFLAGFFLLISFLRSNRTIRFHYSLLFYSLACFSWALADILWAINALILTGEPAEITLITFFYLLTNLFLALGVFQYARYQFKRWNVAKLILDVVVFSIASILLLWILFFNRSDAIFAVLISEGTFSTVSIFTDILIYVGIVIWYLSIRGGKIPIFVRLISGGIFFFVLTDLYYYYLAFTNAYSANSLIDAVYMATLLTISVGGLLSLNVLDTDESSNQSLSTNIGNRGKGIFILICPVLTILIRGFVFAEILIFIALTVIYMALSSYIQNSIKNEELLKKELQLNTELESLITSRTQELHEANDELVKKNDELRYLSNTDTLTNLHNRRYFLTHLEENIAHLPPDQTITLFYMDLDRFKLINDTYGHNIGDSVLIEISNRLTESAGDQSTIARMGGDEFVLAAIGKADTVAATNMAKTIIAHCSKEIYINGYIFYPALCIGISIFPNDAETSESLLKNADIALYHAKDSGINKFTVYNALIHQQNEKRNEIKLFLHRNDFCKDLRLYYQPQFSIPDGKLSGMEALIRWVSSDNEIMTPAEFIQVAEETDQINEIGIWVLKKAVLQITDWNTRYNQNLKMGINISPKQLNSSNLVSELNQLTQNHAFNPQWIDIEITENIAMDGEYRMAQIFTLFKSIGMSVSIDDFGTGYSSIAYLKHYTIDRIKIAKPLIDSIASSVKARQIVQAIVLLAKTIGIHTIAEGVETKDQLDALSEIGCEEIQGFYLGRPVPSDAFERLFLKDQLN